MKLLSTILNNIHTHKAYKKLNIKGKQVTFEIFPTLTRGTVPKTLHFHVEWHSEASTVSISTSNPHLKQTTNKTN